jgi:glycogen(starch) synthase
MGEALTPRSVLMTADGTPGVFLRAVELARALGRLDISVVLAVMGRPPTAAQRREAQHVPTLNVLEQPYKLEWMDEPWADIARARAWLLELERAHAPDVVHLHGYSYASAPFRAPKLVAAHACMLSAPAVPTEPASVARYRENVRQGLVAADSVVAPTHALLTVLERTFGLDLQGSVIHDGIELTRIEPAHKESFVLAAGPCDEAVDIATLARVAPRLAWPVYVAGEVERAGFASEVPTAGADLVQLLGPLSSGELAEWLGRAAIHVHPARQGAFGFTILEAAASGCALVLGDIPSLRELWDGAASFVRPDDEAALVEALAALIDDPVRRSQLADAALQRALQYDVTRTRDAYVRHYRALLERAQGSLSATPRSGVAPAARARPALRPGPLANARQRGRERG